MLRNVTGKFAGGCMMVMNRRGGAVHFLGTAFLVHREGYMVTAARILEGADSLVAVPAEDAGGFPPMTQEQVNPWPVELVEINTARDVALLKLESELGVSVPPYIFGKPELAEKGSTVMAMGFSFGHYKFHGLLSIHGVLATSITSPNGTRLLLFDRLVHHGDVGGPLIDVRDERIIGLVLGRFGIPDMGGGKEMSSPQDIDISYAASIEYAVELMEARGLEPG